ncbi:MAG: MOSC domain-containing protein [Actinomycetota bacterium]
MPDVSPVSDVFEGAVDAIFIAEANGRPMNGLDKIIAVEGRGLEGDRYFNKTGTYSKDLGPERQVTLIEVEAIEAVERDAGLQLDKAETRRNIVTRGVPLNHLVDREFTVGDAVFRGIELCEPCRHLSQIAEKSLIKPLVHRGGLNAEIIGGGTIRIGDTVRLRED